MKKTRVNVKNLLTNNGFRVTDTRIAVLKLLVKFYKPVDVVTIEKQLNKKKIKVDQVTIYRMLEAFFQKGLVKRLDFYEGKFRYELNKSDHHHVICEDCGVVADVDNCLLDTMEKNIRQTQKFLIKRHALEFFGLCLNCQK